MVALVGERVLVGVIVLFAHVIFPCIAAALLLLCNTSDRPTDPDDSARGFHRSTRTHSTTSYFLVSEIARSNRLSHVHHPHCDAASQTPTLPTKETTETPPPQTVSAAYVHIHTCLPALKHTFLPATRLHSCACLQDTPKPRLTLVIHASFADPDLVGSPARGGVGGRERRCSRVLIIVRRYLSLQPARRPLSLLSSTTSSIPLPILARGNISLDDW